MRPHKRPASLMSGSPESPLSDPLSTPSSAPSSPDSELGLLGPPPRPVPLGLLLQQQPPLPGASSGGGEREMEAQRKREREREQETGEFFRSLAWRMHISWVPLRLIGSAHQTACSLLTALRRNVEGRQSDSMLLRGAPGSGKSAALEWALRELTSTLRPPHRLVVARVSGALNGHDCRGALQVLLNALDGEETRGVGGGAAKGKGRGGMVSGSFEEAMTGLLAALKRLKRAGGSCVVVLDQFEMFLVRGSGGCGGSAGGEKDLQLKQVFVYSLLEL